MTIDFASASVGGAMRHRQRTESATMPARNISKKQREREEELAKQSRLAYVGLLAGGLAHEIRSPLQAIKLNLGLIAELESHIEPEKRAAFRVRVDRIGSEVEWLTKLISEFLDFARPPKPARLPTNINELLCSTAESASEQFGADDIAVEAQCDQEMYPVLLDPIQFRHSVLMNVLNNAREAIGEHGIIKLSSYADGENVYIEISDNGPGIPADKRDRIFEAFYSTKEHGTGLGLGIATRMCEELGGSLTLKDSDARGTTFEIRLPRARILSYDTSGKDTGPDERRPE